MALGGTASRILRRSQKAALAQRPAPFALAPRPATRSPAAPANPSSQRCQTLTARRQFHCVISRMDLLNSAALRLSSASWQLAAAPFSFHHRARFLAATPIFPVPNP
jgi:hypothetical protein